jgi:hypothetical protein
MTKLVNATIEKATAFRLPPLSLLIKDPGETNTYFLPLNFEQAKLYSIDMTKHRVYIEQEAVRYHQIVEKARNFVKSRHSA